MSFFQNSVINKYIKALDKQVVSNAYSKFKEHFHNSAIQENIRNSKEEQYQGEFLIDLFVSVLGYTKNPTPNFNLTTEYKNLKDSKKADGAIIIKDVVKAVIELKGTNTTDLNKIETQAFGYKNNQPECEYIITSNFEKLRFYIDNAIEYIEFNLFTLTEKEFELLYVCLAFENIEKGLPKKIKSESVSQEDTITKKLYHDYSVFKKELYHNLVALNPQYQALDLFKISQKLLDRFLFIFFAEDRALLPTNLIFRINKEWQQLREMRIEVSLYDRYKIYFHDLNIGATVSLPAFNETKASQKEEFQIFAYNGGLFQTDDILNAIKIDDAILFKHTENLSNYDFSSEVDVNILGHIFENSLNELDELKAQVEGQEIDKTKTKRKKDGVFYTPKYITKYIVENTIGKLCQDKKAELQINDEDYFTDKKRQKTTKQALSDKLTQYRNWLLQLTICDPACGSGAFLNQALDFLIAEHRYIDELHAKLFGDAMVLSDIEKSILENNLFGVDINEESVEIAKLSLWLRTAQPNRKLNDLNDNIKCGNSLIDDESVAGDKAFNWNNSFVKVFEKGGFDIVIGNPPYVRQELFKEIKPYLEKHYKCYNSIADLYTYFIEKGINLINTNGKFSFILPNKFLKATYGKEVRNVIKKNVQIDLIYDFDDYPIFEDATTYPIIFIFSKNIDANKTTFIYSEINKRDTTKDPINKLTERAVTASLSALKDDSWQLQDSNNNNLISKIILGSTQLKDVVEDNIFRGVSTGKNEVFIINKETADKLINENTKNFIRKIVTGKEVKRYNLSFDNLYLLYIPWEYDLNFDENIKSYLLKNEKILSDRPEVKEGRFNWWCLSRYGSKNAEFLFKPKIIYPRINNECNFFFDETGSYSLSDNNFFISTSEKYLLPILNSKVIFYFLKSIASTLQGGYLDFRRPYMEIIPIKTPQNKLPFIERTDLMHSLKISLQEVNQKFQRSLQRKFNLENLPSKLQDWYLLSYPEFIKELAKKKIKLSLSDEAEWEAYFTTEAKKALDLKAQIDKTDKEIDQMVYKLYDLTDEEIKIVEGN